jgi:hypothetical protein
MFVEIILFCSMILIIYKLYSVLGQHDGDDDKRMMKEIEAITSIINDKKSEIVQIQQSLKSIELDNKIYRELDQTSQDNLSKLFELQNNFSIGQFLDHCDLVFSKIFSEIKEGKFTETTTFANQIALEYLNNLSKNGFSKTLVKINDKKIQQIQVDVENQNAIIDVEILYDQMFANPDKENRFEHQNSTSHMRFGKSFKEGAENKWLLVEIKDL